MFFFTSKFKLRPSQKVIQMLFYQTKLMILFCCFNIFCLLPVCVRKHSCVSDLEILRGNFNIAKNRTPFFNCDFKFPPKNQQLILRCFPVCEEGPGICALIMTIGSLLLIVVSLPVSLLFVVKVVQEYERAVIFR